MSPSRDCVREAKLYQTPRRGLMKAALFLALMVALIPSISAQQQQTTSAEWKPVEDALGRKGSMQPGDVFKFAIPRSDLRVAVAGTPVKPGLALGSWLAFKKAGSEA